MGFPFPFLAFLGLLTSLGVMDSLFCVEILEKGKNTYRLGGSGNTFQARFVNREESQYGNLWMEWDSGSWMVTGEKRENRFLGSLAYQNPYFFLSTGYRYKPFPGFFWGKEPRFSSTLTPHQPLYRSSFLALFPGYLSPGIYQMEAITGKRGIGYSLSFPEESFAVTYAPGSQYRSFYSNIHHWKWKKPFSVLPTLTYSLKSEAMGFPRDYFGRLYVYLGKPEFMWIEGRAYRDSKGNLFESPDPFREDAGSEGLNLPVALPDAVWVKFHWGHYHFLEGFESWLEPRMRYAGVQVAPIPLPWGRLGYRHRTYEILGNPEKESPSFQVPSHAAVWVIENQRLSFFLGREFRANQDTLTEVGFRWQFMEYQLQTVLYFQKEGNLLPFPIERFMADGREDKSLSDRKTLVRFRIRGSHLDWNFTASERMGRRGSLFFMNLQWVYEF